MCDVAAAARDIQREASGGGGSFPLKVVVIGCFATATVGSAYFVGSMVGSLVKWVTRIAICWIGYAACSAVHNMNRETLLSRCHELRHEMENFQVGKMTHRVLNWVREMIFGNSSKEEETKRAD